MFEIVRQVTSRQERLRVEREVAARLLKSTAGFEAVGSSAVPGLLDSYAQNVYEEKVQAQKSVEALWADKRRSFDEKSKEMKHLNAVIRAKEALLRELSPHLKIAEAAKAVKGDLGNEKGVDLQAFANRNTLLRDALKGNDPKTTFSFAAIPNDVDIQSLREAIARTREAYGHVQGRNRSGEENQLAQRLKAGYELGLKRLRELVEEEKGRPKRMAQDEKVRDPNEELLRMAHEHLDDSAVATNLRDIQRMEEEVAKMNTRLMELQQELKYATPEHRSNMVAELTKIDDRQKVTRTNLAHTYELLKQAVSVYGTRDGSRVNDGYSLEPRKSGRRD